VPRPHLPGHGQRCCELPTCPVSCLSLLLLETEQGAWRCPEVSPSLPTSRPRVPSPGGDTTGRLKAKDMMAGCGPCLSLLLRCWGLVPNLGWEPSFLRVALCRGWFRLGDGSGAVRPAHPDGSAGLTETSFCSVPSPALLPTETYALSGPFSEERQDSRDGSGYRDALQ